MKENLQTAEEIECLALEAEKMKTNQFNLYNVNYKC